jgi:transcriptional regulator with XRE-family HTH domain
LHLSNDAARVKHIYTKEILLPQTTVDVAALHSALDRKRKLHELSWRELAGRLDISASTFTRMAQGHRPDIDTFATLLRWLDMPAAAYMRGDDLADEEHGEPDPKADLEAIGSLLRSSRSMNPDQAEKLETIIQAAYKSIVTP